MLWYVLLEKQLLSKKDRILTKVKKWNLYILLIGLFVSALVAPKFIHMLQDNQQVSAAQNSINIPNLIDSAQPISWSIDQSLQFFTYFDENEIVTYGSFLPLLREKFDWEFRSQNIEFSYIPTESVLYPSFKYAIDKWMVWAWVDPNWSVKCQNLMVLLWLAQSRDVDSSPEWLLDSFREEAAKRWLMRGWCDTKDQVVLWSMLP